MRPPRKARSVLPCVRSNGVQMIQMYTACSIVFIFLVDYAMHPDRTSGTVAFLTRKALGPATSPHLLARSLEIELQVHNIEMQVHYTP